MDAAALAFVFSGRDGEASDGGDAVPSLESLSKSLKARRMTCTDFNLASVDTADSGSVMTKTSEVPLLSMFGAGGIRIRGHTRSTQLWSDLVFPWAHLFTFKYMKEEEVEGR